MFDARLGQTPDAGIATELARSGVAQELFGAEVGSFGRVVGTVGPGAVGHAHFDVAAEPFALCDLFDFPSPDPGHLARVAREVPIRVDRTGARTHHPHEDAERLGMGRPFTPMPHRIASEKLGNGTQCALGGKLTDPARLIVHRAGLDARRRENLMDGPLTSLGAHAKQVSLEDGRPELLLPALPDGPPGAGWCGEKHWPKRTRAFGALKATVFRSPRSKRPGRSDTAPEQRVSRAVYVQSIAGTRLGAWVQRPPATRAYPARAGTVQRGAVVRTGSRHPRRHSAAK